MRTLAQRQGLQIGSPDEIAFQAGWISAEDLRRIAETYSKNSYGGYLLALLDP